MVDRMDEKFGMYPEKFIGEAANGNAETLCLSEHFRIDPVHILNLRRSWKHRLA